MTLREFRFAAAQIMAQQFLHGSEDVLQFAILRNQFKRKQLEKLIELADEIMDNDSRTLEQQVMQWKKSVQKLQARQEELSASRDQIKKGQVRTLIRLERENRERKRLELVPPLVRRH